MRHAGAWATATPVTPEPGTTPDITVPDSTPDDDKDGVSNVDEDVNKDGDLTNDGTDGDGPPNFQDDDDDGDGTLTKTEGCFRQLRARLDSLLSCGYQGLTCI